MAGHLVRGHRAAGRYRLESRLGTTPASGGFQVWRAVDETLERQVAIRFFDPRLDRGLLVDRAAAAASLAHPTIVRVFDTGTDGGQFFVVCELVAGSLAWAGRPLSFDDTIKIGADVADALGYAHGRGIAHGSLHAGNVLLGELGAKVADFGLARKALDGAPRPADDLIALGRLLEDIRPPGAEASVLAPVIDRLAHPELAGPSDARTVAQALRRMRGSPRRLPQARPRAVRIAVVVVAVLAASAALVVMRRERGDPNPPEPTGVRNPYRVRSVSDFDPLGDAREGRATVARVVDGDPRTFWSTERYRSGPQFSGRKLGVGVVLDLGTAVPVGSVRVQLASAGCSYEVRSSGEDASGLEGWTVLAQRSRADRDETLALRGARARWWLLWITRLTRPSPGAGDAFACSVAEVTLSPP